MISGRYNQFVCSIISILALTAPGWAITVGQIDDFQDGTTQGWSSPFSDPTPPVNQSDVGPAGIGDDSLFVEAAAFESIAIENSSQWSGDYLSAGIDEILFDYENTGATTFSLGATLSGPGGSVITFAGQSIPAVGGWSAGSINLSSSNLFALSGTVATTLANVTSVELNYILGGAYNVASTPITFRLDNIRVVPEPAAGVLALIAALAWLPLRRRVAGRA